MLTTKLRYLMAIGTAILVGNIYYCQPLLGELSRSFGVSERSAAFVNICTQAGYLLGLFFIVPLGDMISRNKLIVRMHWFAALAMLGAAASPGIGWLKAASVLVGVSTTACQIFIPFAAHLAREEERGRVVGSMMGGLLTGILLSRTLAGFVAQALGWRGVYYVGSGLMVVMAVVLASALPSEQPSFRGSYGSLMRSLWDLLKSQPVIRQSSLIGASLFAAVSAFWATLAFFLEAPPFGYSLSTIGLFGVIGAGGALASPLVGRIADKKSPLVPIRIGIGLMILAYLLLFKADWSVAIVVAGVILLDIGVQCAHVPNLARNYRLLPEARTRLNTIYMTSYFIGGTIGSTLGSLAWDAGGWTGVCLAGLGLISIGTVAVLMESFGNGPVARISRERAAL
ncbi:MAG TPA: MFS transporter [Dinghuibacter sp.]|uniref:MFS transporter n=1 Tax=Dinghuibacter sp. TaxID=2024697 RepID=UPI002CB467A6|nr:MFS transporter [Dinghuibacter sp.]HTJ12435.1 MFS transporter [Dinghuibacter sp.]